MKSLRAESIELDWIDLPWWIGNFVTDTWSGVLINIRTETDINIWLVYL